MSRLEIWVVYDRPSDFPNQYVARKFIVDNPTNDFFVADSLEELREKLPPELTRLDRLPGDDPLILETWL